LVARLDRSGGSPTVLCEHSAFSGNFQQIARQILEKAKNIQSKKTFSAQE